MKVLSLILVFTLVGCVAPSENQTTKAKASGSIYGKDNRHDISEKTPQKYLDWSKSVAGRVSKSDLTRKRSGFKFYSYNKNLCKTEKFYGQKTLPDCSGFLVGPDLIATAGHCVSSESECADSTWVFDYTLNSKQYKTRTLNPKNVYKCSEVIITKEDGVDYALIRLDRKVVGRKPLKFRRDGKVRTNTRVIVIGHPSGLPLKIAGVAEIKTNSRRTDFYTNLDTFGGNSGSPVFNKETGVVEGILVAGATDYKTKYGCKKAVKYSNLKANEKVTRITEISEIIESEL